MEGELSARLITEGLEIGIIGRQVIYVARLSSTMDAARQEAGQGALEGTAVIAGEQTAGRGRQQRSWLSPGGSVSISLILYPAVNLLPSLIMLASVAVVRSIAGVTGLKADIKWPNDVLLNGRKVCGILIESRVKGSAVEYAVIGIGLNVNFDPGSHPEIASTATSLEGVAGQAVSRLALIRRLLSEADRLYAAIQAGDSVFEEWRDNLVTLGQKVRANSGTEVYEGMAENVAGDGSLWLRLTDGRRIKVVAGDVTLSH